MAGQPAPEAVGLAAGAAGSGLLRLPATTVPLGQRAAMYGHTDLLVGAIGLALVWEAARRTTGWAVPILALIFMLYAHESVARQLPDWLFPHRGQDWQSMIGQLYLRTEGVFGTALGVMFRYVFLFVMFGALLEASGATHYIIGTALRLLGKRSGGPAKVAVVASGLMGSLSGSAVANAATTGVFTIPLMRSIGFKPHIAAGIEAAASSGGALAPPVMGAGAYMMLEIINRNPPLTYLEIMRAALIPAILYYLSLFLLVHFYAQRAAAEPNDDRSSDDQSSDDRWNRAPSKDIQPLAHGGAPPPQVDQLLETGQQSTRLLSFEAISFFGALAVLILFLLQGVSPFRAVSYAMAYVMFTILLSPAVAVRSSDRLWGLATWLLLTVISRQFLPAVERWPEALIWGMVGLLAAGLLSRAWRPLVLKTLGATAQGGVPLIVVSACVGIVIGLVSRTGIGAGVPQAMIPLAGDNLFLGLLAIMGCSILLGMGLPSAVSYLLLATIIGPVFADPSLGVPLLAAHLFIFYFGMMAMVTPRWPWRYATASIAGAGVMQTSWAAFRFALVGFTLPFMFVYRPALCLIGSDGLSGPPLLDVLVAVTAATLGIVALAAAMAVSCFIA